VLRASYTDEDTRKRKLHKVILSDSCTADLSFMGGVAPACGNARMGPLASRERGEIVRSY
jgi:hypothetical protein